MVIIFTVDVASAANVADVASATDVASAADVASATDVATNVAHMMDTALLFPYTTHQILGAWY